AIPALQAKPQAQQQLQAQPQPTPAVRQQQKLIQKQSQPPQSQKPSNRPHQQTQVYVLKQKQPNDTEPLPVANIVPAKEPLVNLDGTKSELKPAPDTQKDLGLDNSSTRPSKYASRGVQPKPHTFRTKQWVLKKSDSDEPLDMLPPGLVDFPQQQAQAQPVLQPQPQHSLSQLQQQQYPQQWPFNPIHFPPSRPSSMYSQPSQPFYNPYSQPTSSFLFGDVASGMPPSSSPPLPTPEPRLRSILSFNTPMEGNPSVSNYNYKPASDSNVKAFFGFHQKEEMNGPSTSPINRSLLSISADSVHPSSPEMTAERRLLHRSTEDVNRIVHGGPMGMHGSLAPLSLDDRRISSSSRGTEERKFGGLGNGSGENNDPPGLYSWMQPTPEPTPVVHSLPLLNYDRAKNLVSAGIIGERPNGLYRTHVSLCNVL
ncbi:hypothetical protein M1146_06905, partial [Patescibacteria group bacterium]|nr:hypothetical protein [Patescibacteria group bacterium]